MSARPPAKTRYEHQIPLTFEEQASWRCVPSSSIRLRCEDMRDTMTGELLEDFEIRAKDGDLELRFGPFGTVDRSVCRELIARVKRAIRNEPWVCLEGWEGDPKPELNENGDRELSVQWSSLRTRKSCVTLKVSCENPIQ